MLHFFVFQHAYLTFVISHCCWLRRNKFMFWLWVSIYLTFLAPPLVWGKIVIKKMSSFLVSLFMTLNWFAFRSFMNTTAKLTKRTPTFGGILDSASKSATYICCSYNSCHLSSYSRKYLSYILIGFVWAFNPTGNWDLHWPYLSECLR